MATEPARRSRPSGVKNHEQVFFVTTRTLEEVFWFHPLLCSRLTPVNREARRVFCRSDGQPFVPQRRRSHRMDQGRTSWARTFDGWSALRRMGSRCRIVRNHPCELGGCNALDVRSTRRELHVHFGVWFCSRMCCRSHVARGWLVVVLASTDAGLGGRHLDSRGGSSRRVAIRPRCRYRPIGPREARGLVGCYIGSRGSGKFRDDR